MTKLTPSSAMIMGGLVNPIDPKSGQPFVKVVNAVANYWKHHDDWPKQYVREQLKGVGEVAACRWDTSKINDRDRKTMEIVTSIGMRPDGLNMQAAASALGISELWDLSPLRKVLEDWVRSLLEATS